jgi:hypothetical protein
LNEREDLPTLGSDQTNRSVKEIFFLWILTKTREELVGIGVELVAPYSSKKRDPTPKKSAFLSRLRYRIDTVFSQLAERYCIKKVWARDLWHLASRLLRKVLSHTVASLLNHRAGNRPLQLARLLH